MKVSPSVKKRCENCQFIYRRRGVNKVKRLYIVCSSDKRHKQRQG